MRNLWEINLGSVEKNRDFFESLRELILILFAVVFGVGLSQLGEAKGGYDFAVLFLAYFSALLSWWGYHYGIIVGPKETNILNYFIDCGLLIVYWFLINKRSPLHVVLILYLIMFGLYTFWELVRMIETKKKMIKNACIINGLFSFLIVLLLELNLYLTLYGKTDKIKDWYYIATLYVMIFVYRWIMHKVYRPKDEEIFEENILINKDKELIKKAKHIAKNARAQLSNFRVGAAVLGASGRIYVGCNIEFDNYSNTIHAEESAISSAISSGEKRILSIAVFTFSNQIYFPCGMCRQSLFELGGEDLRIIACNENTCEIKTMKELLPSGFRLQKCGK